MSVFQNWKRITCCICGIVDPRSRVPFCLQVAIEMDVTWITVLLIVSYGNAIIRDSTNRVI